MCTARFDASTLRRFAHCTYTGERHYSWFFSPEHAGEKIRYSVFPRAWAASEESKCTKRSQTSEASQGSGEDSPISPNNIHTIHRLRIHLEFITSLTLQRPLRYSNEREASGVKAGWIGGDWRVELGLFQLIRRMFSAARMRLYRRRSGEKPWGDMP